LSNIITGSEDRLSKYGIHRTTIEERYEKLRIWKEEVMQLIEGKEPITYDRTRETAADIVEAVALGKEFIDIVNVPNQGQIPNLPLGGIVETLGVVNSLGFTPISAGPLPEPIRRLVLPHLENSETLYEAASTGNYDMALQALYNDPTCRHLDYADIRSMAHELLEANKEYLPQEGRS
jgi:alpha-galactosidase